MNIKKYFFGITNLSSFYCLEPKNYSQTIYGFYVKYLSFFLLFINFEIL